MFHYEYPEFKNKQLLKASMLEQLRDYPKHMIELLFQGYGNGIMSGCELSWNDKGLIVNSGIIYWNGILYFMENPYQIECRSEDLQLYLVVKFAESKKQPDRTFGDTKIYFRKDPVRMQDEMELCRFRLQEGARLRNVYKDFRDYSTEYDTINMIHSPFAAVGSSTISPAILIQFAKEMMETEMTDVFDVGFVMNLLANDGRVSKQLLIQYLTKKNAEGMVLNSQGDLYQMLLSILADRKRYGAGGREKNAIGKRIMLV